MRVQCPASDIAISNMARADEPNNPLKVLSQFALMQSNELVEKRTLLYLQTRLAENLEPDPNLCVAEPSTPLEEAHMALVFRGGVHYHNLLIVAPQ